MIVARAEAVDLDTQQPMAPLMLGLSRRNIEKLMAGRPILLQHRTHPIIPEGEVVVIFYAETEEDIIAELRREGIIDHETKITQREGVAQNGD